MTAQTSFSLPQLIAQVETLAKLEDGWSIPQSKAPTAETIAFAAESLRQLELPPQKFSFRPLITGRVKFEWETPLGPRFAELEARTEAAGVLYICRLVAIGEDSDQEWLVLTYELEDFVRFLRGEPIKKPETITSVVDSENGTIYLRY